MPKKKTSTWDVEEWFYTELLQCGPVSEEWAKREFKKKYYLHKGSPEIIMEVALQKLGVSIRNGFLCPPT